MAIQLLYLCSERKQYNAVNGANNIMPLETVTAFDDFFPLSLQQSFPHNSMLYVQRSQRSLLNLWYLQSHKNEQTANDVGFCTLEVLDVFEYSSCSRFLSVAINFAAGNVCLLSSAHRCPNMRRGIIRWISYFTRVSNVRRSRLIQAKVPNKVPHAQLT